MDFEQLYKILPSDPIKWQVLEVAKWLEFIQLNEYVAEFKSQSIDGSLLPSLTDDDLRVELKISQQLKRKKILRWVQEGFKHYSQYLQNTENGDQAQKKSQITYQQYQIQTQEEKRPSQDIQGKKEFGQMEMLSDDLQNVQSQQQQQSRQHYMEDMIGKNQNLDDSFNTKEIQDNLRKKNFVQKEINQDQEDNNNYNQNNFYNRDQQQKSQDSGNNNNMEEEEEVYQYNQNNQEKISQQQQIQQIEQEEEKMENENVPSELGNSIVKKRELIIEPYEQMQQVNFYSITEEGGKIGRHSKNQILLLEESVSRFHAEINYRDDKFFLKDTGSTTGTFIRIEGRQQLEIDTQIEVGSCQFNIDVLQPDFLIMHVIEGQFKGLKCELDFKQCQHYQIGRKKNINQICIEEDQHLSTIHSKITTYNGNFYIEDMESTNGTWLRLSQEGQASEEHELKSKTIFKIGLTNTFICKFKDKYVQDTTKYVNENNLCVVCCTEEKDALLAPCNHNSTCLMCAKKLREQKCPICKQKFGEIIKIYKA